MREADADARPHVDLLVADEDGRCEQRQHRFGDANSVAFGFERGGRDDELVAAEARHGVAATNR